VTISQEKMAFTYLTTSYQVSIYIYILFVYIIPCIFTHNIRRACIVGQISSCLLQGFTDISCLPPGPQVTSHYTCTQPARPQTHTSKAMLTSASLSIVHIITICRQRTAEPISNAGSVWHSHSKRHQACVPRNSETEPP